ncbi:hypothetical protein EDB85DRAFT_1885070 [Lactarius pseudohatsudake]|nr:hypothetical protein EDB85DRAFT_1885070 [Lactarius pseudohatsudake]
MLGAAARTLCRMVLRCFGVVGRAESAGGSRFPVCDREKGSVNADTLGVGSARHRGVEEQLALHAHGDEAHPEFVHVGARVGQASTKSLIAAAELEVISDAVDVGEVASRRLGGSSSAITLDYGGGTSGSSVPGITKVSEGSLCPSDMTRGCWIGEAPRLRLDNYRTCHSLLFGLVKGHRGGRFRMLALLWDDARIGE